jgi:hypothetical protein
MELMLEEFIENVLIWPELIFAKVLLPGWMRVDIIFVRFYRYKRREAVPIPV